MKVLMRKAQLSDVNQVSSILTEAVRYCESIDQPLWGYEAFLPEKLTDEVAAGLFYLAEVNNEAVGVLKYQLEDILFWPDITDGTSGFVHRLAIRRKVASKGVSKQMLQWAKMHTRDMGRTFLRLDCAIRPKLLAFYENCGFIKHSDKQVGTYTVTRFVCKVTE